MQIDTTDKSAQLVQSSAMAKEQMKGMVADYLNKREVKKQINNISATPGTRLNVNLDELRQFNTQLANYVTKHPVDAVSMFENQLDQKIKDIKDDTGKNPNPDKIMQDDKNFPTKTERYYVSFEGNFGRNHVTPRGLKSNLINQLVCVQGIVTRMGLVKPMIQTSVHYCEATRKGQIKTYNDNTNLAEMGDDRERPVGTDMFPTRDANDNPLSAEYGYCLYKDSQTVTIQEMPESAPPGQLPRSINVILQNDLVE